MAEVIFSFLFVTWNRLASPNLLIPSGRTFWDDAFRIPRRIPWNTDMVPSVTISGGNSKMAINSPLSAARAADSTATRRKATRTLPSYSIRRRISMPT